MSALIKRLFDLVVSASLLLLLSPLLLIIAALVRISSPGPVLYRHPRVGRGGAVFLMCKFRTMVVGSDRIDEFVGQSDPRVTPVGRWLRRFSLDELPQLWHVLTGQMSLVGPRPAPLNVAARMTLRERGRFAVRPGLTGWAQIHGRNALSWRRRLELDLWYVEHWSLWLDLVILWRTVGPVLRGSGLYGPDGWNRGYE